VSPSTPSCHLPTRRNAAARPGRNIPFLAQPGRTVRAPRCRARGCGLHHGRCPCRRHARALGHFTVGCTATSRRVVASLREPPLHRVRPRPPMSAGEGFARWSEWTECCRLFATKQQRDASPSQGEAGAQRRVRVDAVVVRPLRVHVVCHPAPRLAAAIPSRDPMQHGRPYNVGTTHAPARGT